MVENTYNAFQGKTVLVTGGAGAVGSNLVKRLDELETKKIIILDLIDNLNFIPYQQSRAVGAPGRFY